MADMTQHNGPPPGADVGTDAGFATIPLRARDQIGELVFYLDQVRQNLLTVDRHVSGSSSTMPSVLSDLKEIVRMTEAATVRVLEEAEALLDEGQACSALIAQMRLDVGDRGRPETGPLDEVQDLVERANDRVMAIMSALEFQDLTAQKIQRAFEVLEEVSTRLGAIHRLVSTGVEPPPAGAVPADEPRGSDGSSAQDVADEILLRFKR